MSAASPAQLESLQHKKWRIYARSQFIRQLRRVVRLMHELQEELGTLSDLDSASVMSAWHRAGLPLTDANGILDEAEGVVADAAGFSWSLEVITGLLESRCPGGV